MSSEKYKVGTVLSFCDPQTGEGFEGKVVPNQKMFRDICVQWDTGLFSSYDESWLDQFTVIVNSNPE
jgi:hypothetical protein